MSFHVALFLEIDDVPLLPCKKGKASLSIHQPELHRREEQADLHIFSMNSRVHTCIYQRKE